MIYVLAVVGAHMRSILSISLQLIE